MKKSLLWVFAALSLAGVSRASTTALLVTGPVPVIGGFAFNYEIVLPGDERLDAVATSGVTCPGPSSTEIQCNPTGTFFTIYDIPGFVSASTSAPGWSFTTQLVGVTPSNVNSSFDSASLVNVTFTYTSSTVVHANGTDLTITGFQIVSTANGVNSSGTFSSQNTRDFGDAIGETVQGVGAVQVPAVPVTPTNTPTSTSTNTPTNTPTSTPTSTPTPVPVVPTLNESGTLMFGLLIAAAGLLLLVRRR